MRTFLFPGPDSIVSVGIAGSNISRDVHVGHCFGTVGYKNTGHCVSSHLSRENIEAERYSSGLCTFLTHK